MRTTTEWRYPCDFELVAERFLRAAGDPPAPSDAFELAWAADVQVHYGSPARTDGERIHLPRNLRGPDRHWCVAHELGHVLITRARMRQSEYGANRIAAGLMLPLAVAAVDYLSGSSAPELLARHGNCSAGLIAARLHEAASILRPRGARAPWREQGFSAASHRLSA